MLVGTNGEISLHSAQKTFSIEKDHQLACYADFCNECGNCDVFCPEDGGPYIEKPKLFGSAESFDLFTTHDGYLLENSEDAQRFRGRMRGAEVSLMVSGGQGTFSDGVVEIPVNMENGDLGGAVVINAPSSPHTVELERVFALRAIYNGMTCDSAINWVVAPTL